MTEKKNKKIIISANMSAFMLLLFKYNMVSPQLPCDNVQRTEVYFGVINIKMKT